MSLSIKASRSLYSSTVLPLITPSAVHRFTLTPQRLPMLKAPTFFSSLLWFSSQAARIW